MKGTSLTQIGDYARCVICLDLSTSLYGHEFDSVRIVFDTKGSPFNNTDDDIFCLQQTALKLSGFKRPSYLNSRRIVEKLLELSKPMGVSEICVQLSLTEIQSASQTLLDRFVSSSGLRNIDTTHPQYAAMAVYQMCRLRKIKIQKSKLISFSHLKSSQWAVLEKSWDSWAKNNADKLQEFHIAKRTQSGSSTTITAESSQGGVQTVNGTMQKTAIGQPAEEYAEWRERILKQAFEDLDRLNKQTSAV